MQFNDHFEREGSDKYSLTLCEQATSKTSKWNRYENLARRGKKGGGRDKLVSSFYIDRFSDQSFVKGHLQLLGMGGVHKTGLISWKRERLRY